MEPRVLVFSQRRIERSRWQLTQFEFEDVIGEVDAIRLLTPPAKQMSELGWFGERVANKARQLARRPKQLALDPVEIEGEYDLFFSVFHFLPHTTYLDHLKGWRERCRKAVCFLVEMWSPELQTRAEYFELLRDFDHVFVTNGSIASAVTAAIGRPCEFMPTATDTLRFSRPPEMPRVIDFHAMGRRAPTTHAALLEWAERTGAFYLYDTSGLSQVPDYLDHRRLVADLIRRSRYFLAYNVNPARLDRTGGDEALSTRYFEGTAGGAVLLGTTPRCPEYQACFDWPDATIEIPYDTGDIAEIIADLDAQPDRLARARRNNIVHSLRRHDWVYRWERVLDAAGLASTAAMRERGESLDAIAASVAAGAAGAAYRTSDRARPAATTASTVDAR